MSKEKIKNLLYKYSHIFLSILTGLLIFLSFPNPSLYLFAWVAFIPLLFVISQKGPIASFFYAFLSGFIANLGLFYWIYPTIKFNTNSWQQAVLCMFFLCAYLALYFAVWALFLKFLKASISIFRFALFSASLWVVLEYLRTYLFTGLPLSLIGYSQWKFLSIIQISEYTGVYGISFLVIFVNVGLFQYIKTKKLYSFVAFSGVLVTLLFFGLIKLNLNYYSSPPYISVALIQGNIDQYKKWDTDYEKDIIHTYNDLVEKASRKKPDIIIWPETAIPGYLPSNAYMYAWVNRLAKQTKTYHLIGAPYYNGGMDYFNATLLFDPEGELLGWHKKVHLVPFGEYVPYRDFFEPYFGVLNTLGDFSAGEKTSALSIKSVLWGTTICSENFFGDLTRRIVKNGAEILTNQTNDAWFFKTAAPMQHFIMNVFRAIENRRPVIVCGNTGVTGIVEASGVVRKMLPLFTATCLFGRVAPRQDITFYTQWGDVFAKICIFITLLMLVTIIVKKIYNKKKSNTKI